ncbi:MAG TPA: pirin family protein [Steroidobacteraceae bacterium]|nr:pirin family protein [Steroidobacteraceae bacterium]
MSAVPQNFAPPRAIVHRTRGRTHGPITRLASPSDLGEIIKPFVFLDLFEIPAAREPLFGWHPHSGIATLTVVHEGAMSYEETTGQKGVLSAGGVEWMRAGRGVWHTGSGVGEATTRGFQLWVALPEALEHAPPQSRYLSAEEVPAADSSRVILGAHAGVSSVIPAPAGINYLDVQLRAGERWSYRPPAGHDVAWLAMSRGVVWVGGPVSSGELVVFDDSGADLEIHAESAARFVLGSAVRHPHALVTGRYSVHTSSAALRAGEQEIRRIGDQLQTAGPIR